MLSRVLSSNLGGAALSRSFLHRRVRPPDSDRAADSDLSLETAAARRFRSFENGQSARRTEELR